MKNFSLLLASLLLTTTALAVPPGSPYNPAETLDPICAPGDTNCFVQLAVEAGSVISDPDPSTNLSGAAAGDVAYNTTTGYLQVYNGSAWVNVNTDIYSANGTTGAGRTVGVTDTLNFDSNTFVIDGTNNRIGVGTSLPGESLQVVGSAKIGRAAGNAIYIDGIFTGAPTSTNGFVNSVVTDGALLYTQTGSPMIGVNGGSFHIVSGGGDFGADQNLDTYVASFLESGNVGIGTTAPSDGSAGGGQNLKLDVEGAVGATHYCDENGANCVAAGSLGSGSNIYDANGTIGAGRTVGVTDTVNFDSNTLVIDGTNNRIGIGVGVPDFSLDVVDSIQIDSAVNNFAFLNGGDDDLLLQINAGTTATADRPSVQLWNSTSGNANEGIVQITTRKAGSDVELVTAGDITFDSSALTPQEMMVIKGDTGNVGIGTPTPSSLLHVNELTAAAVAQISSDVSSSLVMVDSAGAADAKRVDLTTDGGDWFLRQINDDSSVKREAFNINATGNVGIGILSTAGNELTVGDVDGDDITRIALNSGAGGNSVITSGLIGGNQITSFGPGVLPQALTIRNSNGNVGIGIAAPTQRLHVSGGNAQIDGQVRIEPTSPFQGQSLRMASEDGSAISFLHTYNTNSFGIRMQGSSNDQILITDNGTKVQLGAVGGGVVDFAVSGGAQISGLPSGTDDTVAPSGTLAGAVCITTNGHLYIDTDGTCAN